MSSVRSAHLADRFRRALRPTLLVSALAGGVALSFVGIVAAQEAKQIAQALAAVRDAAADRDAPRVEQRYQELLATQPGADARDEAALLLGKTRLLAGHPAEAADAVRAVVDRTASPWSVKALYLTAECAARRRSWREAAEIYAGRVEWASSDLHKAEIAALYREIADGAFEGDTVIDDFGREKKVPNWGTARDFYAKTVATFLDPKLAQQVRWRLAEARLATGDPSGAEADWKQLLVDGAGEFTDDTLYGIGRAQAALQRFGESRATFERLRAEHGDSPFSPLALIRIGETWQSGGQAAGQASAELTARVIAPWQEFLKLYPKHEEAATLAWRIAEYLASQGDSRGAADRYREFLAQFPDHERAAEAQHRIAQSYLTLLDFDRAIAEWQALLTRWPNHPLWAQARAGIVFAAFRKGTLAFEEARDADAKTALDAFIAANPTDPSAAEAQRLLGELLARAKSYEAAILAWQLCATKYAQFDAASVAMFRVAETYEGPLANLDKALAAYEEVVAKWPASQAASRARGILAQMKGKMLEFTVARPFRTDEPASVPVQLRNVSKLRMKAYNVRLEEYLRRKGGLEGVGDVVVDVVKPDQEWDFQVPEFAKYRLMHRTCPLPLTKPGAYIVTAAEEELTATFLVIVSDLTVITKSAAGQALVFVYDERTGKPVQGARVALLGSDGPEGITDAEGVFIRENANADVRAVVSGKDAHLGHVAFAASAAQGVSAFGYATKAFLWTDRPVYRPGQDVKLRAVIRRVRDGRYVTEEDLVVRGTVTDPRGATLVDQDFHTDAFGFVSAEVSLASEPSLGTHSFQVSFDGQSFTQTFDVLAYKKPDVIAEVTPEQRAYLAGDVVKAKASLRFTVGGKVASAPVRYTVTSGPFFFDASIHEAFAWFFRDPKRDAERAQEAANAEQLVAQGEGVTTADGVFELSFPTAPLDQDRTYVISVEAQDPNRRWVRAVASVPVTTRGVYFICRTEKKVYRPGESMRLEVTAVDPLHVPVAMEGRAVLLRRRLADQHFVEDVVTETAAKTGADGHAFAELKATKPGEHVIRFIAKDARGREIVGETTVSIAGDAEDLAKQARLVADHEFYREGDIAKVFINVPVAPVPVLLTWEGERVLKYRVFMATERASTIEMPLSAEHAPNVFLRMAAAKGGALYEDGDEVAVFQYLDVEVTVDPAEAKPGQKVTLGVVTKDQSGKPVRAQVGVDVVDAAIYQIAPDHTAQMKPFFYDQRRTHGVRTASSVAGLPALTRPTNKDLLFEQMRRLGKAQWEAMQEYVRQGRAAMESGDFARASDELRKALDIAPGNYEARVLLLRLEEGEALAVDKAKSPVVTAPSASPSERPRHLGPGAELVSKADAGLAADVPGTGGGESGAFGGRKGGVRRLSRNGGGSAEKKAQSDLKDSLRGQLEEQDRNQDADAVEGDRQGGDDARAGQYKELAQLGYVNAEALGSANAWGAHGTSRALAQAPVFVPAELREHFEDTAYSSASVRTGDDGKGGVSVELPDNLTEWKVTARGAGAGPLVGEGSTRFRTVKKLLVRPDAPRFLTQGDQTTPTGTVHSTLEQETDASIRFTAEGATIDGEANVTVKLAPGSVQPFDSGLSAPNHGLSKFKVEALTTLESDSAILPIPVLPYGLTRIDGASGVLTEEAFAELELPAEWVPGTATISVTASPSIDLSLLESLAYTGGFPWGCVEQTVNRFLPAVVAHQALSAAGSDNERLKRTLDESVRRGLAALYGMQSDDGSFGWFGARGVIDQARGGGDPAMTAYAVLGMVRAEAAGFAVSPMNRDRAIAAAKNLLRGASSEDRAFTLYALSFARQADLEPLNALFRERAQLSPRSLALLALAMQRTGRGANAMELIRSLEAKAIKSGDLVSFDSEGRVAKLISFPRPINDAEATAYALLAFIAVDPENALVDGCAAWLLTSRRGPAWRSTRDTGAAIEALAEHARLRGVKRAQGDVSVYLNDGAEPVATLKFGGGNVAAVDAPVSVNLPAEQLKAGKNRVILRRRGAGRVQWTALAAAVWAPPAQGEILPGGVQMDIARDYTEFVAPPLPGEKVEDRIIPGWSVVVPEKRPVGWNGRPLGLAGTGDKVRVTLTVNTAVSGSHMIVEDPLPAGFEVVSGSATGAFDREERRDDRQAFFIAHPSNSLVLSYVIQAIHPGQYRALPARARLMYEPEIHAWSAPRKVTVTRDPGAVRRQPSAEEVTPDEIWAQSLRALRLKDFASARSGIETLMSKFALRPEVQEEAWSQLFAIGVETKDAKLLVQAFEQMTDRNPRRAPQGLRERRALADGYRTLGEDERATVLLRDLVRDLAAPDFDAAASFVQIGNPWRARGLAATALSRLPDSSWSEELELRLARDAMTTRAMLPRPAPVAGAAPVRPSTNDAQPFLLDEAVRAFRAFEAHHADSPLAHEAGLFAVNALMLMKLQTDAVAEGIKFLARFPSSPHLDDVTLLVAQGSFEAGEYDRALETSRRLIEGTFPVNGDLANPQVSPFRNQGIHINAKIAHVRGDLPRAVSLYREVSGLFPDAADALAFLTQTGLTLREVESGPVGTAPALHLRRKNVPSVELDVYAVDFMILYAMKRDLASMNRIDLSGIEPVKHFTVARRGPEDFKWSEEEIALPVKEKGVYLVVARATGSSLDASSVVIVSDIELSVQESGGRLRVYTTDRTTGKPVGEVYVKVGNGASIQAQGFTDARGVFDVPAVAGSFSVVAEKDQNVGFWRR